jgi:hypothetical protein
MMRAVAMTVLGAGGLVDTANAQCVISASTVTLTSGSCTIAPNTTLTGSPIDGPNALTLSRPSSGHAWHSLLRVQIARRVA